ncbi:hypothetical protein B0H17DRAFT_1188569 [Mycena rosella]|uniref:Uncharacterized protein n=1 Tax=Mycena rosella TaxID=1033263 RepID=A0AAD7BG71_MYCRO|nr:hypothetical protein B0H17DRAFT_1188569 [Mycena rosella]
MHLHALAAHPTCSETRGPAASAHERALVIARPLAARRTSTRPRPRTPHPDPAHANARACRPARGCAARAVFVPADSARHYRATPSHSQSVRAGRTHPRPRLAFKGSPTRRKNTELPTRYTGDACAARNWELANGVVASLMRRSPRAHRPANPKLKIQPSRSSSLHRARHALPSRGRRRIRPRPAPVSAAPPRDSSPERALAVARPRAAPRRPPCPHPTNLNPAPGARAIVPGTSRTAIHINFRPSYARARAACTPRPAPRRTSTLLSSPSPHSARWRARNPSKALNAGVLAHELQDDGRGKSWEDSSVELGIRKDWGRGLRSAAAERDASRVDSRSHVHVPRLRVRTRALPRWKTAEECGVGRYTEDSRVEL